ncbi:uncharacterized protein PHALS_04040 [Plasmopara halstedii]|uniref:Uncharacterized protein n=1 Tax=Plasmopara halstedii TaxID=4781 RepID=A0A0P1A916_PLAHL|nr:uncharacterized protein PHALS_04040 [Plasmopara halstedii]CEG36781.1 hypothetical protein PHALS_04040 [Plasmopara halstedii]|eukprot:XP_024573150.1 hypothetical protein PHALS_04040 [Plasmopara halstedii]
MAWDIVDIQVKMMLAYTSTSNLDLTIAIHNWDHDRTSDPPFILLRFNRSDLCETVSLKCTEDAVSLELTIGIIGRDSFSGPPPHIDYLVETNLIFLKLYQTLWIYFLRGKRALSGVSGE